jgi:hypothetical protein
LKSNPPVFGSFNSCPHPSDGTASSAERMEIIKIAKLIILFY